MNFKEPFFIIMWRNLLTYVVRVSEKIFLVSSYADHYIGFHHVVVDD